MLFVRPIALEDFAALVRLTEVSGFGLTSLPKDPELLRRRILESLRGFESVSDEPRGKTYLFVMEDGSTGEVVGTSGILAKVGGFEPFYAYRIEGHIQESQVLRIRKEIQCLHLVAEHSGPCEIGSLFLHPDHRRHGAGRLMSLCRFLFMAEHPAPFDPMVIAEMRGVIDDRGGCPFWEGLGRHFFDIDFPNADHLSMKNKRFIAELMPVHPIYIALLSEEARSVIGRVHPNTEPALKLLQEEGFEFGGMIDIFDGGPIVGCPLDQIRTVRESLKATVAEVSTAELASPSFLIGNTRPDFRACVGPVTHAPDGGVRIPEETAEVLEVSVGEAVRFAPLRPAAQRKEA